MLIEIKVARTNHIAIGKDADVIGTAHQGLSNRPIGNDGSFFTCILNGFLHRAMQVAVLIGERAIIAQH